MPNRIHACWALAAVLVGLALTAGTTPARAADPAQRLQVFLLAGQSNMEGQGVVSMDHPQYYNGGKGNLAWSLAHSASKDRMRHLRDASGQWVVRDDVQISFKVGGVVRKGPLTVGYTGYGGSSHIGPELQFGHVMGDFNAPRLPLVIGELGNGGPAEPNSGMQKFRDAQRQGASRIENAVFVPTQDFARPPELSPNVGHGHHWYGNAESYFLIGDALGEGMKKLLSPRASQ